jgi:MFS family permease
VTPEASASPRPGGAMQLMFDPTFGGLFWAKILSVVGVWIHCIVAAVVVFDETGSALMVGLVGVVQFGPQLVLSPISGKWADTGNPARQIQLGRLLCTIGSASIALCLIALPDLSSLGTAFVVLAGSSLVGIGFVVGGPAMQSIVPSLIRPGELPTAMALNSVPMTLGRMAGPVVGAYLTAQVSAASSFFASAGLSFVFVVYIALATLPKPPRHRAGTDYRVRAALRYVRNDRQLALALLAVATVGFASDPSITLAPSMASELRGGTHLVGWLTAAFGGGAALGLATLALTRGRVSSTRASTAGLCGLAVGSAALALGQTGAVALVGFGLAGLGFGWAMAALSTVIQEHAPDELRGRIMALWMVGFVGSRPAAAAILGGAADHWSTQVAFAIAAALTSVVAVLWLTGIRRNTHARPQVADWTSGDERSLSANRSA